MVSPARRRDAVRFLVRRRRVSERRACRLVGQHRSTQRYERVAPEYELRLVARMNDLAAAHPRYGYRRIWALLRSEGWRVNRKRIERLWRLEGHRVPPRRRQASGRRAQGTAEQAIWSLPAARLADHDRLFARPQLNPTGPLEDIISPENMQGINTASVSVDERNAIWTDVVEQVARNGCGLGYEATPPPLVDQAAAKAAAQQPPAPLIRRAA
jgi:hypothetical protein